MNSKWVFAVAAGGIAFGMASAYLLGVRQPVQAAVFAPVASPFASAIYTNGMVESEQAQGANVNIFPEVPGRVVKVLVSEGQKVEAGAPLLAIDDSVQRATTAQLEAQAEAAHSLLLELRAQPRKENLAIAQAQLIQAEQNLATARNQYDKRADSYKIDPRSISRDAMDTARDTLAQADAATLLAAAMKNDVLAAPQQTQSLEPRRMKGALADALRNPRSR